jgi:hypothetical protein
MCCKMKTPKPILITGSHRSGTTWVGRIIATSPSVGYINEPFNINYRTRLFQARFDYWFTYVNGQNEHKYYRQIKNAIEFRYNLWCRWSHKRPLLKDPIALFSAEWLSSRFNMDTVVLIRHPAAFAGSLKIKNWTHPFSHFLNQPLLMNDHLQPFKEEIEDFANNKKDIIDQAALLWNITHYMILKYRRTNPYWIYVRHEDLSRNPLQGFCSLFENLKLDFSDNTVKFIERYSFTQASKEMRPRNEFTDLNRDSLANIYTWKQRLTSSEIERVKSKVQKISQEFYSEYEW